MKYLDIDGLCEVLCISPKKAEALMKTEDFPSIRVGRSWRVLEDDLMSYLKGRKSVKLDYRGITHPLGDRVSPTKAKSA